MAEQKKRKTLPKKPAPQNPPQPIQVREDFSENTFAGALSAVKKALEDLPDEVTPVDAKKKR
jgi:hypothetical protein